MGDQISRTKFRNGEWSAGGDILAVKTDFNTVFGRHKLLK